MKKQAKVQQADPKNQPQPQPQTVDLMKALDQSMAVNNFSTNFQFAKDLGIALLQGNSTPEHIKVLNKAIQGIKGFIEILENSIKNRSVAAQ